MASLGFFVPFLPWVALMVFMVNEVSKMRLPTTRDFFSFSLCVTWYNLLWCNKYLPIIMRKEKRKYRLVAKSTHLYFWACFISEFVHASTRERGCVATRKNCSANKRFSKIPDIGNQFGGITGNTNDRPTIRSPLDLVNVHNSTGNFGAYGPEFPCVVNIPEIWSIS